MGHICFDECYLFLIKFLKQMLNDVSIHVLHKYTKVIVDYQKEGIYAWYMCSGPKLNFSSWYRCTRLKYPRLDLSACMYITHNGHNNTIQVYSGTVMTHVIALEDGQSSPAYMSPLHLQDLALWRKMLRFLGGTWG